MQTALTHLTAPAFWMHYQRLSPASRKVADKNFQLLKADPYHPSLHFKKIGRYWSVRSGLSHRALGKEVQGNIVWFWIGTHAEYDKLIT